MKKSKLLFGMIGLISIMLMLASCGGKENSSVPSTNNPDVSTPTEGEFTDELNKDRYKIYLLALDSGFSGSYEEWVASITGDKIELRVNEGKIEWKYSKSDSWVLLIKLEELIGPNGENGQNGQNGQDGKPGENGADGLSVRTGEGKPNAELGILGDSYIDLSTWDFYIKEKTGWVLKGNIKGQDGENGQDGKPGENGQDGKPGENGQNGQNGQDGKPGENGADGLSVRTGEGDPTVDLGVVGDSYIDLTTWNYYVKEKTGWVLKGNIKGQDGENGQDGKPGENGQNGQNGQDGKPGENGQDGKPGVDGREVEFTTSGTHIQWRYKGEEAWKDLISLEAITGPKGEAGNNGQSAYEIAVQAGFKGTEAEWLASLKGTDGLSAYQIYKKYHPEYTKSEAEWIEDLANGTLTSIKHKVVFNSNGGTEVAPVEVSDGKKLTKPTNPTKEGFVFDGWYLDGERWSFNGFSVTSDITLEAKWTSGEALIIIRNGNGDKELKQNIKCGTEINIKPEELVGKVFEYWYDFDNNLVAMPYIVTHSTVLVAKYRDMTTEEKIQYDLNSIEIPNVVELGFDISFETLNKIKITVASDSKQVKINMGHVGVLREYEQDNKATVILTGELDGVKATRTVEFTIPRLVVQGINDAMHKAYNYNVLIKGVVSSFAYSTDNLLPIGYYVTDETGTAYVDNYNGDLDFKINDEVTLQGYVSYVAEKNQIVLINPIERNKIANKEIKWQNDYACASIDDLIRKGGATGATFDVACRVIKNNYDLYCLEDINKPGTYVIEYLSGNNAKPEKYASLLKNHLGEIVKVRYIINARANTNRIRGNVAMLLPLTEKEQFDYGLNEAYKAIDSLNLGYIYGSQTINLPNSVPNMPNLRIEYTINAKNTGAAATVLGNALTIDATNQAFPQLVADIRVGELMHRTYNVTLGIYPDIASVAIKDAIALPDYSQTAIEGKILAHSFKETIIYDGADLMTIYNPKGLSFEVGSYVKVYGIKKHHANVYEIEVDAVKSIASKNISNLKSEKLTEADITNLLAKGDSPIYMRSIEGKLVWTGRFYELHAGSRVITINYIDQNLLSVNIGKLIKLEAFFNGNTYLDYLNAILVNITEPDVKNGNVSMDAFINLDQAKKDNLDTAGEIVLESGLVISFNKTTGDHASKFDGKCVRFYAGTTMTITATKSIAKIEFIPFTTNPTLNATVDTGAVDSTINVWTGNAATITFTATSQFRFTGINITYA